MRRIHFVSMMALIVAIPAATAGSYFASGSQATGEKPCFVAGNTGYRLASGEGAAHIVRIDNTTANPSLRMQQVDDPAAADFVLVDEGDIAGACANVSIIETIRIDAAAAKPDLTVALSRAPAAYKIYLRSTTYTEQDAAALAAVIWQNAGTTGSIRTSTVSR
jgi:hypothetical protein